MAVIAGQVTLDSIRLLDVDTDPSVSGGTPGNIGDMAIADSGQIYINRDGSATNWRRVMQQSSNVGFTAGSIPFADSNGDLTENNTGIKWDNVNTRLGLGITTPQSRLHLDAGTATASHVRFTAGKTTGQSSTDGFRIGIDAAGIAQLQQYENLAINFLTNNTQALGLLGDQQAVFAKNIRLGDNTDTTDGNILYDADASINGTIDFFGRVAGVWRSLTGRTLDVAIQNNNTSNATTSTSMVNLLTTTPVAGTYLVIWSADATNSPNGTGEIDIALAGTVQNNSVRGYGGTALFGSWTGRGCVVTFAVIAVNGSQQIQARYRSVNGTFTLTNKCFITVRIA